MGSSWWIQVCTIALLQAHLGHQFNQDILPDYHDEPNNIFLAPPDIFDSRDNGEFDYQETELGESAELGAFSSRLGEVLPGDEQGRGIFSYTSKRTTGWQNHPPNHHHGPKHGGPPGPGFHHVPPPAPFIHGGPPNHHHHGPPNHHGPPPHHHHHHHPPRPKAPHYVKYWQQNKASHHHKSYKPKDYKVYKPNPLLSLGYLTDLAERLADGVGILPEYAHEKKKNTGWHKHGKYHFKGITYHSGFFTEVL